MASAIKELYYSADDARECDGTPCYAVMCGRCSQSVNVMKCVHWEASRFQVHAVDVNPAAV